MSDSYKIDVDDCSFDPNTCSVVQDILAKDRFEEQVSELDPESTHRRNQLANFVVACVNGSCPGQNLGTFRKFLENLGH